jgi:hypothetical protein
MLSWSVHRGREAPVSTVWYYYYYIWMWFPSLCVVKTLNLISFLFLICIFFFQKKLNHWTAWTGRFFPISGRFDRFYNGSSADRFCALTEPDTGLVPSSTDLTARSGPILTTLLIIVAKINLDNAIIHYALLSIIIFFIEQKNQFMRINLTNAI